MSGQVLAFPTERTAGGRKVLDRRGALAMARSGATEFQVERLYGADAALWARAVLWEEGGCDRADKRGQEAWTTMFEGGGE